MPMYSDEDAAETVRMESSNADAWREGNSCAVPHSSKIRGRTSQAAAPSVNKGATSTLHQRRGRVIGRRYWSICVALVLMTLFLSELLLARWVLRPVAPTASVGHAGAGQRKAGQRAVTSSTTRPPASTEAAVGSRNNDAAATAASKRAGIGEELLPPTTQVPWVNASPPVASPDVASSVHRAASAPLHEQVTDTNRSAVTEGNAAQTATNAETLNTLVEELLTSSAHTSATTGNPLSSSQDQHQHQQPTSVTHVPPPQPPKQQDEEDMRDSPVPPPRPAPWAKGGGSVRLRHMFSILTVLAGAPLTTPSVAGDATSRIQDKEVRLLKRAAMGLYRSGMAQHASFHEWLLVHNKVLELGAQKSEEATVREWWRVARSEQEAAAAPSLTGLTSASTYLPHVRVAGLPHTSLASPLTTKLAFALLHGVRLVVTEYIVLHDLQWTLTEASGLVFGGAADAAGAAFIGRANSANTNASPPSSSGNVVQREITLALQTLSKNGCPDLPTIVVDQERSGATEDVHAYRLQVYASQEWRQPEREAELQSKLIAYVQKIRSPTTASPSVVASVHKPMSDALISSAATAGAEATAASEVPVQNGLPIVAYSASAHFHCQHAPLYGTRILAPLWLRPSRHKPEALSHSTRYGAPGRNASTPSPPLTTLCEALVSSQLGLGDAYAVQGSTFHRVFCQEWLQFALLPSPKTPIRGNTKLDAASEAEVTSLMATLRKSQPQRESDVDVQRMDMAQRLGDGLCTVEWVAHLKAAQLHYREMAERKRWRADNLTRSTTTTATSNIAGLAAHSPASPVAPAAVPRLSLSNAAGWSPYLNQYATLLFSKDTGQLSLVAGTYLAFLPNVHYALQHIRRTVEDKLASVSLKYAVERTRRFTSVKQPTDREVVCLPSHLSRVHRHAAMYNTQWFLSYLGLRCVQHKSSCLGGLFESEERTLQNMDRYLSTTGKWSRGEFRVCMSAGVYVSDPLDEML